MCVNLAAEASRLAALLVGHMHPACSLLAPCDPGASTPRMAHLFPDGPLEEPARLIEQHVDEHAGDRHIQPDRQRPARNRPMPGVSRLESARERDEDRKSV